MRDYNIQFPNSRILWRLTFQCGDSIKTILNVQRFRSLCELKANFLAAFATNISETLIFLSIHPKFLSGGPEREQSFPSLLNIP